ncbi:unnamed protein product [Closterium sp. Yama58-4]|nr:unnamed protein product [Closterium sp. Yama58-4]
MTHLRMGEQGSATDYCNRAQRLLATMRMAGVQYSTAFYVTHVQMGLPISYNLMKHLMVALGTRKTLNEDSLTSFILQDEAMQEAERSMELLPQANCTTPTKQGSRSGQHGKPCGSGSGGGKPAKDASKKKSAKDSGRGLTISPSSAPTVATLTTTKQGEVEAVRLGVALVERASRTRISSRPRRRPRQRTSTSAKDADSSAGGKGRGDKEASCTLVGIMEPTVSLAPKGGEDLQVVAAAVVLLDSGCLQHLMGTKEAFVDLESSGDVKHIRGFNGALQSVCGRGTVTLQGDTRKQVLIPDILYVPGVQANLLSAGQLKESGVKLQDDGDETLLISAAGNVLGQATYTGRVLCTDLHPCSASNAAEVVALQTTVSATKWTLDRLHARLMHVSIDNIRSSAKHEVAAKDGGLYFLLLKDRKTRYVWLRLVAKKSDVLREFQEWLVTVERQAKKLVLMLRSDRGGEFLGKEFTAFVDGKGIVHDLTCPYTS